MKKPNFLPILFFAILVFCCAPWFKTSNVADAQTGGSVFGIPGDLPVTGDWNGDGKTEIGIYRAGGTWGLDYNGSRGWDNGDVSGGFGAAGDVPVTGDWNGDGKTEVGVFRGGNWWGLDYNDNLGWDSGDVSGSFGASGDVPVAGDWNNDGKDEIGIFRSGTWALDSNGNRAWDASTDTVFSFGTSGDIPAVGDWNGDGKIEVGVYRPSANAFYLDSNGNRVWDAADSSIGFGQSGDLPVVGDWDGSGKTTVAVYGQSNNTFYFYQNAAIPKDTITISGRVVNGIGQAIPNVTIELCGAATNPKTDANGHWSAIVASGTAYCARLAAGLPSGYTTIQGISNNSCYSNYPSYEWQAAGQNKFVNCASTDYGTWDLASDNNIDFTVYYLNQNCIPNAVSGCSVCRADGSGWVEDKTKCPRSYKVGVNYHAVGPDFEKDSFIGQYADPAIRQKVKDQLQSMADQGIGIIKTTVWLVRDKNSPSCSDPGQQTCPGYWWKLAFPPTNTEINNLRQYVKDVGAIKAKDGHSLELDINFARNWCADFTIGSPDTTLGKCNFSKQDYINREIASESAIISLADIKGADGLPVLKTAYLDSESMVGLNSGEGKPNQGWFLTTFYPGFVSSAKTAGIEPSVYFILPKSDDSIMNDNFVDTAFPFLDGHESVYYIYRTLNFMKTNGLEIPKRLDFSCYPFYNSSLGNYTYQQFVDRVIDDLKDALPHLGLASDYELGIAETGYPTDILSRLQIGQAFYSSFARNNNPTRVSFWTTPDSGNTGVHAGYPFDINSYLPARSASVFADKNSLALKQNEKGTANISWTTLNGANSQVWVSLNGAKEILFAQGAKGNIPASFLVAPGTGSGTNVYNFNLYDSTAHLVLLASTTVKAVDAASSCLPKTCQSLGYQCGASSDGCGGILNCGTCAGGQACSNGVCLQNSNTINYLPDNFGPSVAGLYLVPKNKQNQNFFALGSQSSPWYISQWGNPGDLIGSGSADDKDCYSAPALSRSDGSSARVCLLKANDGKYRVELGQNGSSLPCLDQSAADPSQSAEFDLLVGPNPYAWAASVANLPSLDKLQNLNCSFGLQIYYGAITKRCGVTNPWADNAMAMAAVNFSDSITGQTLFYQIILDSSNTQDPNICGASPYWFYAPQPGNPKTFGVNDYIDQYGIACQKIGEGKKSYNLDLLPRLKNLIANSPGNMDRDISHWKVSGLYLGNAGYGSFVYTSIWDNIGLTGAQKNSCAPKTCGQLNYSCGTASDGCGGTLSCGTCASGKTCSIGVCVASSSGGGGGDGTANQPEIKPTEKPVSKMARTEILAKINQIKLLLIQLIQQLIIELQKQLVAVS